ncbi:hypothetical protein PMZ80_000077 [Knufia obscura]|uniref:Uncharacterized protein n=2 Tax=Knufia TaxID=430999 RepID=A0AAN8II46_9EURO|nr:hypothetical protein PMZ80_000077 [Knufia obscura]KAK5948742.1 hypothetical protein OHC33_010165 [Knufia fluminis]
MSAADQTRDPTAHPLPQRGVDQPGAAGTGVDGIGVFGDHPAGGDGQFAGSVTGGARDTDADATTATATPTSSGCSFSGGGEKTRHPNPIAPRPKSSSLRGYRSRFTEIPNDNEPASPGDTDTLPSIEEAAEHARPIFLLQRQDGKGDASTTQIEKVDLHCPPAHADRLPSLLGVFDDSSSDEDVELGAAAEGVFEFDPNADPDYFKPVHSPHQSELSEKTPLLARIGRYMPSEDERAAIAEEQYTKATRRMPLLLALAMVASGMVVVLQVVVMWLVFAPGCASWAGCNTSATV